MHRSFVLTKSPGTGVTISANTISGFRRGVSVAGSYSSLGYSGPYPGQSDFAITINTISSSVADGIHIVPGTDPGSVPSGGTVSGNTVTSSGNLDCNDTTGPGAGTASSERMREVSWSRRLIWELALEVMASNFAFEVAAA